MPFAWLDELKNDIWPTEWPHKTRRYKKMSALYDDTDLSRKQLRYMHLYIFHFREIRKNSGSDGPGMSYQPYTALYLNDYFGYA